MMQVNLISKKRRAYKSRNWTKFIILFLFGSFGLYFITVSLYVTISLVALKRSIAKVNDESVAVSAVMLKNNDKLSRFVLTKLILSKIFEIDRGRFHYKDYLDRISLLLPAGSSLSSVGFASKGWISVSVFSPNINSFKFLEESLLKKDIWSDNEYFSGAYIEDVTKENSGAYVTRLQLELKKRSG